MDTTFYFQTLQGEQLTVPVSGLYSSASIVATQVSRYATAAAVIEHWEPGTDLRST